MNFFRRFASFKPSSRTVAGISMLSSACMFTYVQTKINGPSWAAYKGGNKVDLPETSLYIAPSSESNLKIFSGSGNPELAQEVASRLGIQLGRATIGRFSDGEVKLSIHDNVREKDVYIIQPTYSPINDSLMELLLLISTLKRSSANRVIAIIPYYAYARQIDNHEPQTPIAAADVALLLQSAGVDQVVCIDLHRAQVQGFFEASVPVTNLDTTQSVLPYFLSKKLEHPMIFSCSLHSVYRGIRFRDALTKHGIDANLGMLYVRDQDKSLVDLDTNHHQLLPSNDSVQVIGDVRDKDCVIVEDMIDSASRVTAAAKTLRQNGARNIYAYATHGLFTGDAINRINNGDLSEIVVFNTIPLPPKKFSPIVRQLSVGGLIAESIKRIHNDQSLSELC